MDWLAPHCIGYPTYYAIGWHRTALAIQLTARLAITALHWLANILRDWLAQHCMDATNEIVASTMTQSPSIKRSPSSVLTPRLTPRE